MAPLGRTAIGRRRQWPADLVKTFPTPTPNRNLALYGDKVIDTSADDYAFALDARGPASWLGKLRFSTSAPVTGYPIAYAVKGRQYVAFVTGQSSPLAALMQMTPENAPGAEDLTPDAAKLKAIPVGAP